VNPTPACGVSGTRACTASDACKQDSDCTAGTNGRCNTEPSPVAGAPLVCSYDACSTDSDCGGAPCDCRPSGASGSANTCVAKGGCALDSDCGPGGSCSPSLVDLGPCDCSSFALCPDAGAGTPTGCSESVDGGPFVPVPCLCSTGGVCGEPAYFCHTACDECHNDSDCAYGGRCLYDRHQATWECFAPTCPL
jgi:hypothetical protein